MGRILQYKFYEENVSKLRKKIQQAETISEQHTSARLAKRRSGGFADMDDMYCTCKDCKYADTYFNDCETNYVHQKTGHELGGETIYSKESMLKELKRFVEEEKMYEVSVLALIYDEWYGESCLVRYE